MTRKECFFVGRLVVFNQTFTSMQENHNVDHELLWHEEICGRNITDVASAYMKCKNPAATVIVVFWANSCASQNKNWICYTRGEQSFLKAANSKLLEILRTSWS